MTQEHDITACTAEFADNDPAGFHNFRNNSFRDDVLGSSFKFCLIGIPVIVFFYSVDQSFVSIDYTLKWRILGFLPLVNFLIIYLCSKMFKKSISHSTAQWLGVSLIFGTTAMMAGLLYNVIIHYYLHTAVTLAGTMAGCLLALFAGGLLRSIYPHFFSAAIVTPYAVMASVLFFRSDVSPVLWIFLSNIYIALPLVIIVVRQREQGNVARLRALFVLKKEREELESTVASRTEELELLIKELHHRVRNNLQTILSLISLYDQEHFVLSHDKKLGILQRAVQVISSVHDLTHNEQVSEIVNMKMLLDEICSENYWREEGIVIESTIEDSLLDIETAVLLGVICIHILSHVKNCCTLLVYPEKNKSVLTITTQADDDILIENPGVVRELVKLIDSEIQQELSESESVIKIIIPRAY